MPARMSLPARGAARRQRGAGIIETMVGVLIGLLVILAIYQVFASAESYKRITTAEAEAQVTGLYAQFILAREVANAGNGIAIGFDDLGPCANPLASSWQLKPIPILITDGGGANVSDSFVVFYSTPLHVANPVVFLGPPMSTPAPFIVQSPNGFKLNDWIIAADASTGNCWLTKITVAPSADAIYGAQGGIDITYAPVPGAPLAFSQSAKMLNLGQDNGTIDRVQYTVNAAKGQLYSQVVATAGSVAAGALNPVAQNIVLMKAQYGIDPTDTNIVTFWTSAVPAAQNSANTNGIDYSVGNIGSAATTAATIRTIKAVRIGIVVRSEEVNLNDNALKNQPAQYLFNCSTNNAACQGRIKVDNVGNGGVLADGYRYRLYETTIPLRNAIWNK